MHQLQDTEPRKRLYALQALMREEFVASVPAAVFLTLFRTDPDGEIQSAALDALVLLGERAPLQPLLELLIDPAYEEWRGRLVEVLGHLGEKAPVDLLVELAHNPAEEPGVRESALESLVGLKERVPFSVFLQALVDEEPALRAAVARAVAADALRVPAPLLRERLADPEGYVRAEAVRALTRYGAEAPIEPLVALLHDPEPRVREKAALAVDVLLEWFGARVPLDELVRLIGDPVFYVRETAIDALSNHPECAPVHPLSQALKDENLYVRMAAAEALIKMGKRVSIEFKPALQEALNDADKRVSHKAAFVLLVMAGLADPDDPPEEAIEWTIIE